MRKGTRPQALEPEFLVSDMVESVLGRSGDESSLALSRSSVDRSELGKKGGSSGFKVRSSPRVVNPLPNAVMNSNDDDEGDHLHGDGSSGDGSGGSGFAGRKPRGGASAGAGASIRSQGQGGMGQGMGRQGLGQGQGFGQGQGKAPHLVSKGGKKYAVPSASGLKGGLAGPVLSDSDSDGGSRAAARRPGGRADARRGGDEDEDVPHSRGSAAHASSVFAAGGREPAMGGMRGGAPPLYIPSELPRGLGVSFDVLVDASVSAVLFAVQDQWTRALEMMAQIEVKDAEKARLTRNVAEIAWDGTVSAGTKVKDWLKDKLTTQKARERAAAKAAEEAAARASRSPGHAPVITVLSLSLLDGTPLRDSDLSDLKPHGYQLTVLAHVKEYPDYPIELYVIPPQRDEVSEIVSSLSLSPSDPSRGRERGVQSRSSLSHGSQGERQKERERKDDNSLSPGFVRVVKLYRFDAALVFKTNHESDAEAEREAEREEERERDDKKKREEKREGEEHSARESDGTKREREEKKGEGESIAHDEATLLPRKERAKKKKETVSLSTPKTSALPSQPPRRSPSLREREILDSLTSAQLRDRIASQFWSLFYEVQERERRERGFKRATFSSVWSHCRPSLSDISFDVALEPPKLPKKEIKRRQRLERERKRERGGRSDGEEEERERKSDSSGSSSSEGEKGDRFRTYGSTSKEIKTKRDLSLSLHSTLLSLSLSVEPSLRPMEWKQTGAPFSINRIIEQELPNIEIIDQQGSQILIEISSFPDREEEKGERGENEKNLPRNLPRNLHQSDDENLDEKNLAEKNLDRKNLDEKEKKSAGKSAGKEEEDEYDFVTRKTDIKKSAKEKYLVSDREIHEENEGKNDRENDSIGKEEEISLNSEEFHGVMRVFVYRCSLSLSLRARSLPVNTVWGVMSTIESLKMISKNRKEISGLRDLSFALDYLLRERVCAEARACGLICVSLPHSSPPSLSLGEDHSLSSNEAAKERSQRERPSPHVDSLSPQVDSLSPQVDSLSLSLPPTLLVSAPNSLLERWGERLQVPKKISPKRETGAFIGGFLPIMFLHNAPIRNFTRNRSENYQYFLKKKYLVEKNINRKMNGKNAENEENNHVENEENHSENEKDIFRKVKNDRKNTSKTTENDRKIHENNDNLKDIFFSDGYLYEGYFERENSDDPLSLFTPSERLNILLNILQSPKAIYDPVYDAVVGASGGAGFDISDMRESGIIDDFLFLHDREELREICAGFGYFSYNRDRVRDYFGSKISFYLSFLHFYTTWLLIPGALSLVAFFFADSPLMVWFAARGDTGFPSSPGLLVIYAMLVSLAATVMVEYWKRKESYLGYLWQDIGENLSLEELPRPEFISSVNRTLTGWKMRSELVMDALRLGTSTSLSLFGGLNKAIRNNPTAKRSFSPQALNQALSQYNELYFYPPIYRALKVSLSLFVCLSLTGVLVGVLYAVFVVGGEENNEEGRSTTGTIITGVLTGLAIPLLNALYKVLAVRLTDWEMHSSYTDHDRSLYTKIFIFRFFNGYSSLFLIAFISKNMTGVATQLVSILITGSIANNVIEILSLSLSQAKWWGKRERERERERERGRRERGLGEGKVVTYEDQVRRELRLAPYLSLSLAEDYIELLLSFGYAVFFSVALPMAPFIVLVSNIIEFKVDSYKLNNLLRRPYPWLSNGIGDAWIYALEAMALLSIIVNVLLVSVTDETRLESVALSLCRDSLSFPCGSYSNTVWFIILLEHLLLGAKALLMVAVPATSADVSADMYRQRFYKIRETEFRNANARAIARAKKSS